MIESTGMQQVDIASAQNRLNSMQGTNFNGKSDQEMKKAAQEFEAVFIGKLLNIMDQTVQRDPDSLFAAGKGEKMFRSMFFDEVAKDISSNPNTSFGLAKQMYEQMKSIK